MDVPDKHAKCADHQEFGIGLTCTQVCAPDVLSLLASHPISHLELNFEELISLQTNEQKDFIEKLSNRYQLVISGHSLNLASTDELDFNVLKKLRELDRQYKPAVIHESLSWSALAGHHSYLELPLPYTEANLELLVERVFRVQEALGRKLSVRNIKSYVDFVGAEFTQGEFLYELARITCCQLVLDKSFGAADWDARIPKDFISVSRWTSRSNIEEPLAIPIFLAPTVSEAIECAKKFPPFRKTEEVTDRFALEAIQKKEVELKEGIFEAEPRRILLDEVTRGFGIRANADLAVFEGATARDGLSVYNQQYFIQIRNVLQSQYRSLSFLLSGSFDRIVADYLAHFPPTSNHIHEAGREFEYFLRESFESNLFAPEMLADLARLEYAMFEVSHEPDHASIDQGVMMEIESGLWDRVIFKLNDKVRLVEAGCDVAKTQKAILTKGKPPETPKPQRCFYLVYRLHGGAFVQMIGRPEARALKYAWNEMTFIKICERIATEEELKLDEVIQQTFSFIHRWAGLGLVKAFDFRAPQEVIDYSGSAWDHER